MRVHNVCQIVEHHTFGDSGSCRISPLQPDWYVAGSRQTNETESRSADVFWTGRQVLVEDMKTGTVKSIPLVLLTACAGTGDIHEPPPATLPDSAVTVRIHKAVAGDDLTFTINDRKIYGFGKTSDYEFTTDMGSYMFGYKNGYHTGSASWVGSDPGSNYQRTSAAPHVKPAPNAVSTSRSPLCSRPSFTASSRARGMEAAVVLPYFWMLLKT